MNARTKSGTIILATLVLGILVGALGASFVINNRVEQLRSLRTRTGFVDQMESVIQPVDEAQRLQIRAVLEKSQVKMSEIRRDWLTDMHAYQESTRTELSEVLNAEQRQRVEEWFQRGDRRNRRRGDRSPPGPPGGDRPPPR